MFNLSYPIDKVLLGSYLQGSHLLGVRLFGVSHFAVPMGTSN